MCGCMSSLLLLSEKSIEHDVNLATLAGNASADTHTLTILSHIWLQLDGALTP